MSDGPSDQGEQPTTNRSGWSNRPRWQRWSAYFLAAVLVVIVLAAIFGDDPEEQGRAVESERSTPTTTVGDTSSSTGSGTTSSSRATSSSTATRTSSGFGDGTHIVGDDITSGTYRARGGGSCYWARLSGFGGTLDDIIANGGFGASPVVTIERSDAGFETSGCGTWTKSSGGSSGSSTRTAGAASFGNGTHLVGDDIAPGTYRAPGGDGCYWARLRGFGGTLDDIIANGGFGANATVTIAASDAGFESSNCGTWTKR